MHTQSISFLVINRQITISFYVIFNTVIWAFKLVEEYQINIEQFLEIKISIEFQFVWKILKLIMRDGIFVFL